MKNKYLYCFFIALTGVSIAVLCLYFTSHEKQGKNLFVERILENGGAILVCDARSENNSHEIFSHNYKLYDIEHFKEIYIENIKVNECDFNSIAPLRFLKQLFITKSEVNGSIFEFIESPCLDYLAFNQCQLPSKANVVLKNVRTKNIGFTDIKMKKHFFEEKLLHQQDHLEMVMFFYSDISDNVTTFFDQCPRLKTIFITGANIRCEFIRDMKWCGNIEAINIAETNLDDDILPFTTRFPKLKELTITNCKVTERSKPILEKLAKQLWSINVSSEGNTIIQIINDGNYYLYFPILGSQI